ncbi:energy-coupling factor ABC transporter ATP-binding protein [Alkalihalobacterium bogoriense]|uniref:energy-coupling factor ABC transporter ATP-binding protein n=1 Tax=Alkalihalobacterium bogoriense TaxID=246272 RepID=UPI00047C319B|nr:ABC transporter ATP-binding protein [Alkalihalobacterium bogoriense]
MIVFDSVSYRYNNDALALENLSCTLTKQKVALLGANGSGKSTLLQHVNGLLLPDSGMVSVDGEHVTKQNLQSIRKTVGIVFDNPENQLFAPTVYDDIAFGPRNKGLGEEEVAVIVHDVLKLLQISELQERMPYHLSLGQKKKVAIAGVLAMQPQVLLFDEPFSGLDPISLQEFLKLLEVLSDKGHTIVVTTHDVDVVYGWADECVVLQSGKVLVHGTVEILEDRERMTKAKLTIPTLVQLFEHTSFRPKSIEEAKMYVQKKEKVW